MISSTPSPILGLVAIVVLVLIIFLWPKSKAKKLSDLHTDIQECIAEAESLAQKIVNCNDPKEAAALRHKQAKINLKAKQLKERYELLEESK